MLNLMMHTWLGAVHLSLIRLLHTASIKIDCEPFTCASRDGQKQTLQKVSDDQTGLYLGGGSSNHLLSHVHLEFINTWPTV